ncbi:hypothetical protein F383_33423 [Gossypium arboreum]|uniref:Uncharacterized protein n=1 Tax=Gossypium arboreum TaxID=29729 RepID=A0A0B0PRA7_GOSAR|nr:hypothetical protein F383_33423 [Gossypium arboreum]
MACLARLLHTHY